MAAIHQLLTWGSLASAIIGVRSDCILYGVCNNVTDVGRTYNCFKNSTPPIAIQDASGSDSDKKEVIQRLREYCPFFTTSDGTKPLCCDIRQATAMLDGLENLTPFIRCPTCYQNLLGMICHYGCGPTQDKMISNADVRLFQLHIPYARSIDFIIDEEYAYKVFNSCKEVSVPSSGGAVVEITCGVYGRALCNPKRWLDFMYDPDLNQVAPFRTTWHLSNDSGALKYKAKDCNESWDNSSSCSCVDCPIKCQGGVYPDIHSHNYIFAEVDSVSFFLILTTFVLAAFIVILVYFKNRADGRGTTYTFVHRFISKVNRSGENLHKKLESCFRLLGETMAYQRYKVLLMCTVLIFSLSGGIYFTKVTTDPVELWASLTSISRTQKDFFDQHFGPFYRTNQVFIKTVGIPSFEVDIIRGEGSEPVLLGPGFDKSFLNEVFRLQKLIENITFESEDENGKVVTKGLESICVSPMRTIFSGKSTVDQCLTFSLLGLFENSIEEFNKDLNKTYDRIIGCIQAPFSPKCLAPYGGPIIPGVALGGSHKEKMHQDAIGVTLSFMTANNLDQDQLKDTRIWEQKFVELLQEYDKTERPDFMDIAYNAERSIEDEIQSFSKSTALTIGISYVVMFLYISIALGKVTSPRKFFLESKITVALGGVAIVFSSVASAVGICAYIGLKTTMLTIEVVPFFVLAVGVDNMFIMVQSHQSKKRNDSLSVEESIGETLAQVGPSMLLTTSAEILCFVVATSSTMPAVYTFAVYSTIAVTLDFLFQMTAFVAILAIDEDRYRKDLLDIFCCLKVNKIEKVACAGFLERAWKDLFVPFVMNIKTRCVVIVVFVLMIWLSLGSAPYIEVGLDQKLAMPEGSHVLKYFEFVAELLGTGPNVYWVTKGEVDYFDPEIRNRMCGSFDCNADSINVQLFTASMSPETTYLSLQANSWLDDFNDWSESTKCCRYFKTNDSFCPHLETSCETCNYGNYENMTKKEYYQRFLPHFLSDNPDPAGTCAKGGHPAYASSISYITDDNGTSTILASNVMSFYTVLRDSKDYIEALRYSRFIAENLTKTLNVTGAEIFPYSIFHVFYEQYLTIWEVTIRSLTLSYVIVFITVFLLTGFSFFSAFCVTLGVGMITTNLMGLMWAWNITLNAISLVNLVMSVGIGVEFCGHMVYCFHHSKKMGPVDKARDALENTGLSVLSGITLTKFSGIVVLAFANSQIFTVFYFRMYMGMVVIGALHSLIFLPALLSILGRLKYGTSELPISKNATANITTNILNGSKTKS